MSQVFFHVRFVLHISISCVSIGIQIFFKKPSQLDETIKSKKMPRLNNDERNQAIGILSASISVTVVSQHFGCNRKTIEHLLRRFCVTGNVCQPSLKW